MGKLRWIGMAALLLLCAGCRVFSEEGVLHRAEDMTLWILCGTEQEATAQKTVRLTEQPEAWMLQAQSADPSVATALIHEGALTVQAESVGETTVTITARATDSGRTTEQTISVAVEQVQIWRILISAISGAGLIVLLILLGRPKYLPQEETEGET